MYISTTQLFDDEDFAFEISRKPDEDNKEGIRIHFHMSYGPYIRWSLDEAQVVHEAIGKVLNGATRATYPE